MTGDFMAWFERLSQQGIAIGGAPLEHKGIMVTNRAGRAISDGPFAESKEAIGGFFLLNVESLEQAVEIAKQCPTLKHGVNVEVRQVAPDCPMRNLQEALATATA